MANPPEFSPWGKGPRMAPGPKAAPASKPDAIKVSCKTTSLIPLWYLSYPFNSLRPVNQSTDSEESVQSSFSSKNTFRTSPISMNRSSRSSMADSESSASPRSWRSSSSAETTLRVSLASNVAILNADSSISVRFRVNPSTSVRPARRNEHFCFRST